MKYIDDTLLASLQNAQPLWLENPHINDEPFNLAPELLTEAEQLWTRFAPLIAFLFPETASNAGQIESPLLALAKMKQAMTTKLPFADLKQELWLKADHTLAIAGSVKARGGIFEILKFAESLALATGLFAPNDDYRILAQEPFLSLFKQYQILVGSTGNLGLSIGLISAKLGFKVTVHMSQEAKAWKKALLRQHGVTVIEHSGAYEDAVAQGRIAASEDPYSHFVDDEQSQDLFLGYATAAKHFALQAEAAGIHPTEEMPLYVYLPCGVGGAPSGIAYGLKMIYGASVKCVIVEPCAMPCMLLSIMSQLFEKIAVTDIGLNQPTIADGLAVGRSSPLASRVLNTRADILSTVVDERLLHYLQLLYQTEGIFLEPSACAGFVAYAQYLQHTQLPQPAYHVIWATGGSKVPEEEKLAYLNAAAKS